MNGSNFQWEDFVELPGAVKDRQCTLNRVCQIVVSIFEHTYQSASDRPLKMSNRLAGVRFKA